MEDCLEQNKDGGHNPAALRHMQDLVQDLRYIGGPFGEKPGSLASFAQSFWNPRNGSRWSTTDTLNHLRQSMLHDLGSLRMLNNQMQD